MHTTLTPNSLLQFLLLPGLQIDPCCWFFLNSLQLKRLMLPSSPPLPAFLYQPSTPLHYLADRKAATLLLRGGILRLAIIII